MIGPVCIAEHDKFRVMYYLTEKEEAETVYGLWKIFPEYSCLFLDFRDLPGGMYVPIKPFKLVYIKEPNV